MLLQILSYERRNIYVKVTNIQVICLKQAGQERSEGTRMWKRRRGRMGGEKIEVVGMCVACL